MIDYQNLLLRQLLVEDIEAELLDAWNSVCKKEPAIVSLGFQFWHKYHPELLVGINELFHAAHENVQERQQEERQMAFDIYRKKIMPVVVHSTSPGWVGKVVDAVHAGSYPTQPPLLIEDFMKPYVFPEDTRFQGLLRLHPTIFRAFGKADRYQSPFAQRYGIECSEGWLQPLSEFCGWLEGEAVALKNAGVKEIPIISQIKEKFGSLTIYASRSPEPLHEEIGIRREAAEAASLVTCESCGAPGQLYKKGWHHVYCKDCQSAYEKKEK